MSVASRITAIEEHIGDIYDTLEIAGTTETTKNIVNINSNLKDRLKYFLNNGVEVIWNNWEKVIGEGTEFTLENTIQAPMKINLKGDTYQKTTTGKQLYDKDNVTLSNHYIAVNGETSSAPDWLCTYDYVKIEPNTDYIVSFENMGKRFIWAEYDENKTCIGNRHENTTGAIQTTTAKYIRFCTNNPNAIILQVEEGTTATTPEEYTGGIASPNPDFPQDIQVVSGENTIMIANEDSSESQNYTIDLGDIELCKIGDYQDKIYKQDGKWYLHKEIGKVVLDGSESWQTLDAKNTGSTFYSATSIIDNLKNGSTLSLYSNNFTNISNLWANNDVVGSQMFNMSLSLRFRILKTSLNEVSIDGWKTWLQAHNTLVYYILATPTTTEITDTTLLSQLEIAKKSYDTQTNISQDNDDLPFILDVTALKNI
jgi:hypothetical protein